MPKGIWKKGHPSAESRLKAKIIILDNGCWLYTGGLDTDGYGIFWVNGKSVRVHRYAYELWTGKIVPEGLTLDHLCRNRACINPKHMEPVTNRENVLRGILSQVNHDLAQARTSCPNGHLYTEDSFYIRPDGARRCRICRRLNWVKRKEVVNA